MTLYRLELRWWGRMSVIRHYSAADMYQAIQFAREDGHHVEAVRRPADNELIWLPRSVRERE